MKLPILNTKTTTGQKQQVDITIRVGADSKEEAAAMQEAIQSFVQHFSLKEMQSAARKLQTPSNRKMIKTFL